MKFHIIQDKKILFSANTKQECLGWLENVSEEYLGYDWDIVENNIPILFVAFSHTLTQSQIDGFKSQYGRPYYQEGCGSGGEEPSGFDAKIITLKDVAPDLQAQMSNIPTTATLADIQKLAKAIVAEAVKAGATHFFCVSEPTLTMWANLYASRTIDSANVEIASMAGVPSRNKAGHFHMPTMVCIQSTTERRSVDELQPDGTVKKIAIFSHVMWREMF